MQRNESDEVPVFEHATEQRSSSIKSEASMDATVDEAPVVSIGACGTDESEAPLLRLGIPVNVVH